MGLKSTRDTLVTRIEEVANTSEDLEQLAYAGASLEKLVAIDFNILPSDDAYNIGSPGTAGFGVAALRDELVPDGYMKKSGHDDVMSPEYGMLEDANGSIFEYIPPFYYKMTGNIVSISSKSVTGFSKPRAFYDSPNGFLHFKYLAGNTGGKLVSKQFLDPLSTSSSHNGIGDLISAPSNNYAGFIDACKDAGYKTTSIFEWHVLQIIALAQSQSGASSALCAYSDVSPFFPKGNLVNALHDANDTSVTFVESGYSNCALTGSGSNFQKTTHNGQASGIADVTGNMWKIVTGLTYLAKTGATGDKDDTAVSMPSHGLAVDDVIYFGGTPSSGSTYNTAAYVVTDVTDANNFTVNNDLERDITSTDGVYSARYFRILKTSVNPKDLTSQNLLDSSNYDMLNLEDIVNSNSGSTYFGNGSNSVLNFSVDANSIEYKKANCGIPTTDGVSASGTDTFGNDYLYRYLRHGLVPLVGGAWGHSSNAGVFALSLYDCSSYSYTFVGGFASVSL
jgi:hypothetical protein